MQLRSRLKSTWHDPVWSKVIAAGLLAAAGAAWTWRNALAALTLDATTSVRDILIAGRSWLGAPAQLTHIEVLVSGLIVIVIAFFTRRGLRRRDSYIGQNYVDLNQRLMKFEWREETPAV